MTIAAEMMVAGMHFVVYVDRYATLLEDLERNGLDMTPIHGDIMTAGPILHKRVSEAIMQLTPTQRHINLADVFYHSAANDNPETGGWYDHINPALLIAQGGMPCVARFKSLTPGHYCGNETAGNRRSTAFECTTDGIIENVGRAVANAPQQKRGHWATSQQREREREREQTNTNGRNKQTKHSSTSPTYPYAQC